MRNPDRLEPVLNTILEVWKKNPDLRLCQLILNLVADANTLYYVEDEVLVKALKEMYDK